MVQQRYRQPVFVLCTLILIAIVLSALHQSRIEDAAKLHTPDEGAEHGESSNLVLPNGNEENDQVEQFSQPSSSDPGSNVSEANASDRYNDDDYYDDTKEFREIFSIATWDRKYVPIFYQGANVINPSILPHPTEYYLWILIAQHEQSGENVDFEEQLVCTAVFYQGTLMCINAHTPLPVQPSIQGNCEGQLAELASHFGPRNTRVFYGPEAPYVLYESQSQYGCLGVWIQDARQIIEPFRFESFVEPQMFITATEVQRPGLASLVEENFFLFWDDHGQIYVHHDLFPQRVFALLEADGSVGDNLASQTSTSDQICYAKYMPLAALKHGILEQSTNSLSVTLCKRADSNCILDNLNTFIMHIFHVASTEKKHSVYESYAILFERTAPFAVIAISQKPIWVHGRKALESPDYPEGSSERIRITSMNWKAHTQRYHGYIDDLVFLGFGIEGSHPGAMDVLAGDLLQDLAFC